MPRDFAARKDKNHSLIVQFLQISGYLVVETYRQGDGCPDIFVLSKAKKWVAFEIKTKRGRLSPAEKDLFDRVGMGPYYVVTEPEQAAELMQHYDNPFLV